MEFECYSLPGLGAEARIAAFRPEGGRASYQVMIRCLDPRSPFSEQLAALCRMWAQVCGTLPAEAWVLFKRYFLSDPSNQAASLPADEPCAVSAVGQPPLNGTKIALWALLQEGVEVRRQSVGLWEAAHGAYRHLWYAGAAVPEPDSERAMMRLFEEYAGALRRRGSTLSGNCLRTWLFARDVDIDYRGVVAGRNTVFRREGLTADTHFIASTGIGGTHADPRVHVSMDACAVEGLAPQQVRYLHAAEYLNSPHEYGVAFERGTAVDYGDRREVYISGTASIDSCGRILFAGDVLRQAERMLTNVGALLAEAGCGWEDVAPMIVYLRDGADHAVVDDLFARRFPDVPRVIVAAPVCRPGWLIEMECMAFKACRNTSYAPF